MVGFPKDGITIKTDQDNIMDQMEASKEKNHELANASVSEWERQERASDAVKVAEARVMLECKSEDPKMTVGVIEARITLDKRYIDARDAELIAIAKYKRALADCEREQKTFEQLKSMGFMLGKIS